MKESTQTKLSKLLWGVVLAPILILICSLGLVSACADIPSFEELEHPENKLATQVIADGGELLTTYHLQNRSYASYEELGPYLVDAAVATEDVRFYRHSGIDFKSLGRVAVKTLMLHNSSQGGGSTITQQLAKTLYPREDMSSYGKLRKTFKLVGIKLKEWITAVKLERNYTKDEIVTMYLNSVEYGSSSFGVKAAARTFYGKNPEELNVEEAAMLVGMVNAPTRYNPVRNPEKALGRRNFVLKQMYKADRLHNPDGSLCTRAQLDSLQAIPVDCPDYKLQDHNAGYALYFRTGDMLRRTMNAKKPQRSNYIYEEMYRSDSLRWENDDLYGWLEKYRKADGSKYNLDKDGLRIYTTIDLKMQKYAEEAVAEHLGKDLQKSFWRDLRSKTNRPFANDVDKETVNKLMRQARLSSDRYRAMKRDGASDREISKSFDTKVKMRIFTWDSPGYIDTLMTPNDSIRWYKSHLRAGFVAIEPVSGYVRAYVGGPNYRYFKYDNVSQSSHQVGSTIKPFLYTLAMQNGMNPCTRVFNVPQTFIDEYTGDTWTPRSTDKDEWIGKEVTLKWGLTKSSNNISAYLMKQYGPHAMANLMREAGFKNHIDEVPALCVGSADFTVMEMVAGYCIFPSGGIYAEPLMVTRIEDNMGNVITNFSNRKRVAIDQQTAYLMVNLMQGVVNEGTASRLRGKYALKGPISGKTGTTNDHADGWFIGYTPKICAGGWVGGENPQIHFQSLALGGGSNMALPIWGIWMKKIMEDGTLGISENDSYAVPAGVQTEYNCDGSDADAEDGVQDEGDSNFFE